MAYKERAVTGRRRAAFWGVAVGAAAAGAALPAALAWGFLHPPRRLPRGTPKSRLGLSYERIGFRASDGVRLRGWWVPAPDGALARGAVVICHGYSNNRTTMLPYLAFLHRAGYHTLFFDFRAHGWSSGRMATFGIREIEDVRAAVTFAQERTGGTLPLALLGESMGASVALLAAAEDDRVRAVIADSPYARFDRAVAARLRLLFGPRLAPAITPRIQTAGERLLGATSDTIAPVLAAPRIAPRPILLIQGLADQLVEPENARLIHEATEEFGNVTLWEVPDARHAKSVLHVPDEYAARVTAFLEATLLEAG